MPERKTTGTLGPVFTSALRRESITAGERSRRDHLYAHFAVLTPDELTEYRELAARLQRIRTALARPQATIGWTQRRKALAAGRAGRIRLTRAILARKRAEYRAIAAERKAAKENMQKVWEKAYATKTA